MTRTSDSSIRQTKFERSFLITGATLFFAALFVVVILFWIQRGQIREQILSRDTALIEAVARMEFERADAGASPFDGAVDFALGASELDGIIGLAVINGVGEALALVPETLLPYQLFPDHSGLGSHAVWHPDFRLDSIFVDAGEQERLPLVEIRVSLPYGATTDAAFAVYWMDGRGVAREFAELDRRILAQAALVTVVFAAVAGGLIFPGYRRLGSARRELERRHSELRKANAELLLAAKASALGALSANLVHGLKNPVAGLERFLAELPDAGDAREAARRMRAILDNTTHMLRGEERRHEGLSFTVGEILDEARSKVSATGKRGRLDCEAPECGAVEVPAREAHLILLILVNLIENAFEASGPNGHVTVSASVDGGSLVISVQDDGPGVPDSVRNRLFEGATSTKSGGSGLGLAISRQLARQIDGDLELVASTSAGSKFRLKMQLPASAGGKSSYTQLRE